MDNIAIARLLDETAALLEIDAADPFRIRSYRRAAEAVEQQTTQLATLTIDAEPKALLAIAGIGKGMAANIVALVSTGTMPLREELCKNTNPPCWNFFAFPAWAPRQWPSCGRPSGSPTSTPWKPPPRRPPRQAASYGREVHHQALKGIEDYRRNSGRFRIDRPRNKRSASPRSFALPGIDEITPAGSLRRGRETVGDLDLLVTGPACEPEVVSAAVDHVASLPLIDKLLAKGQNKVTFTLRGNLQVDVRLLPRASYGAALQYFTGSKMHNVASGSAPSNGASHSTSTRSPAWKTTPSSPPLRKRKSIGRLSSITFHPSCAKTAEKSSRRQHAPPKLITHRYSRRSAHAHHGD